MYSMGCSRRHLSCSMALPRSCVCIYTIRLKRKCCWQASLCSTGKRKDIHVTTSLITYIRVSNPDSFIIVVKCKAPVVSNQRGVVT